MNISALAVGRLVAAPEWRVDKFGAAFVTARIVQDAPEGPVLIALAAFQHLAHELAAYDRGDVVAVSGRLRVRTWTPPGGGAAVEVRITAETISSALAIRRKRRQVRAAMGCQDVEE